MDNQIIQINEKLEQLANCRQGRSSETKSTGGGGVDEQYMLDMLEP